MNHPAVEVGLAAVVGEVGEHAGQGIIFRKLHHHAVYRHGAQQAGSGGDGFAGFGDDVQLKIVVEIFGHRNRGEVVVQLAAERIEKELVLERVFLAVVANDNRGAVFEDVLQEVVVERWEIFKIRSRFGEEQ